MFEIVVVRNFFAKNGSVSFALENMAHLFQFDDALYKQVGAISVAQKSSF